ncbi:collagen and calcium-binding EGF domain-containing protein 1-like [Leptopilina heterotoma]|uniref:collagen and calcium-binding EGF domain-containing protein 1-like n=1 Tax=Leptopilina heterotoma TaxID=63436 RepID=UPI001CA95E51|nr:collagen and calcium-binding EGF domain-containing protein 1-like [Leptopilina heterotoma]
MTRNNKLIILIIIFLSFWIKTANFESKFLKEKEYFVNNSTETTTTSETQCPSSNLIRTRYKCKNLKNEWVDCTRTNCCPGYNFFGGHCIQKGQDPCSLNFCEQRCSLLFQKIICTCWSGYKFNSERQKRGLKPVCVDIDECVENSTDCEQLCINEPGGFSCGCNDGFILSVDNKTCEKLKHFDREKPEISAANDEAVNATAAATPTAPNTTTTTTRCYASCDSLLLLQNKVKQLQERILSLETAMKLSNFYYSGQVADPIFEETKSRDQAFGSDLKFVAEGYASENEKSYPILDSFVRTDSGYCKCQRGPIGPPGPPGTRGQKGDAGEKGARGHKASAGNFDFLLFLLADIRHDIVLLQEKVFTGEIPAPKLDLQGLLRKHRLGKERNKIQKDGSWSLSIKGVSDEEIEDEASGWDQYED